MSAEQRGELATAWCEGRASGREAERQDIVAYLRRPGEFGDDCSVEREVLAQRLERLEHLK